MLARLLELFRRPAGGDGRRAPAAAPRAAARPPPVAADTMAGMLSDMIAGLGPVVELEPEAWSSLARDIGERARVDPPPPPSLPSVVTQALSLARQPELDLNELVGIVQRDAAIATAMLRIANSPLHAPASPVTTVRGAIQSLGLQGVIEVVLGTAGKSFYAVASPSEIQVFPALWHGMFDDAIANAFTAGRFALDVRSARSDRALLAGLLADIGRPLALRIASAMVKDGAARRDLDPAAILAALDEAAPAIGNQAIEAMKLPEELRVACLADYDVPTTDAQIARLVAAIGAIQRRTARIRLSADEVRARAERLSLGPLVVRTLFATRSQYLAHAAEMFGHGAARAVP